MDRRIARMYPDPRISRTATTMIPHPPQDSAGTVSTACPHLWYVVPIPTALYLWLHLHQTVRNALALRTGRGTSTQPRQSTCWGSLRLLHTSDAVRPGLDRSPEAGGTSRKRPRDANKPVQHCTTRFSPSRSHGKSSPAHLLFPRLSRRPIGCFRHLEHPHDVPAAYATGGTVNTRKLAPGVLAPAHYTVTLRTSIAEPTKRRNDSDVSSTTPRSPRALKSGIHTRPGSANRPPRQGHGQDSPPAPTRSAAVQSTSRLYRRRLRTWRNTRRWRASGEIGGMGNGTAGT